MSVVAAVAVVDLAEQQQSGVQLALKEARSM
jgi:hypothetical protein